MKKTIKMILENNDIIARDSEGFEYEYDEEKRDGKWIEILRNKTTGEELKVLQKLDYNRGFQLCETWIIGDKDSEEPFIDEEDLWEDMINDFDDMDEEKLWEIYIKSLPRKL